jgi:ATP-dependent DNA ligase
MHLLAGLVLAWGAWLLPVHADAPPAMLLAETYAVHVDVTRYWMSEKFDGVRAQWDGRMLRFRGGGLSDALRRQPPIGARITYRYQHLTKSGVPRHPRYLRVRDDF